MASRNPLSDSENIDFNYLGSRDEQAETRTVASRARLRDQMQSEIEAFLSRGGQITSVDANVKSEPPTKPASNYGSRPI